MDLNRFCGWSPDAFVMASLALGLLGKPEVVSVYRFRGAQPVPIGLYELVPDDEHPAQDWRETLRP